MPDPPPLPLPEPPTASTLASARADLAATHAALAILTAKVSAAESDLARLVAVARASIVDLDAQRAALELRAAHARAYVAPVRRLPQELLRQVFLMNWEEYPCCGWVLAAVCTTWRRLALSMPVIWSKIRLVTSPTASADTIRLWLERAGPRVPLDIEIFLQVSPATSALANGALARPRIRAGSPWTFPGTTTSLFGGGGGIAAATAAAAAQLVASLAPPNTAASIQIIQGGGPGTPIFLPAPPPPPPPANGTTGAFDLWGPLPAAVSVSAAPHPAHEVGLLPPPSASVPPSAFASTSAASSAQVAAQAAAQAAAAAQAQLARASTHWGHIAMFYLVEQMARWERFVFRFDRQFQSAAALKSIMGNAPLLKEFEVSCAEPIFYGDWQWLPSANPQVQPALPALQALTLQYTPFKWTSPMLLRSNLRRLHLRALPTQTTPLDRVLHIVAHNPLLEDLTLHFPGLAAPVLPLAPTPLRALTALSVGGHYLMAALVDALAAPALERLALDIDAREPLEDCISGLLARSQHPPLRALSIAYGGAGGLGGGGGGGGGGFGTLGGAGTAYFYGNASVVSSWAFLGELSHLRALHVGSAPLDPLLSALGVPDDEGAPGAGGGGGGGGAGGGVGADGGAAGGWACPFLEHLALKACPAHSDAVAKLVQMVEGRNPDEGALGSAADGGGANGGANGANGGGGGGGGAVARLRRLEMYECAAVGPDVVEWMRRRVEEVVCVEPPAERCSYPVVCAWP